MTNTILKLISENQIIMLDTSVAMDGQFKNIVDSIEMPLMEHRRKIIIKKAVWAELLRHLGSTDPIKQRRATTAVEIIAMHQNIFEINDSDLDAEKILKSFADAEFLADLMIHKHQYTQALLTNDKKLSRDANKLNVQESCLGKPISVYNLSSSGIIVFCPHDTAAMEHKEILPEKTITKEIPKENNNILPIIGSSATALIFGVVIGKYGKQMLRVLKSVA